MNESNLQDLPSGLAGGRLEGISVPDLLWNLCQGRRTGVLRITRRGVTHRVYLREGDIIFAGSGDPDDRLGEMLLREDLITLDQLERAASRLGSGKRLGTVLVEVAAITPQDLVQGVLSQVKRIILGLFSLEDGEYQFDEGPLPTDEVITVNMKTGELLLEGIRQVRSFSRIRRSVGPPRTGYRRTGDWERAVQGLELREGEEQLLLRLGDGEATVESLCREVHLSNFEVYQTLWAFKVLGAIAEVERTAFPQDEAALEGHLGFDGIGPILVRLCRNEETGVLYVSHGALDRTFHIREGQCVFATSSNIDDGLMAHLMRRGVISLHDREETAKRLLSNKRVGTILRELGVISESDLQTMVREQISEIVFDTFRWHEGEYAFVAGELPTFEEITVELSVEDIVLSGVRRVTSWSRVRDGCGGLEAMLALAPQFLEILDRMKVGQEEWDLVTALRSPKTVRELCRENDLGDFTICQIVWALRLLGAVRVETVEEREYRTEATEDSSTEKPIVVPTVAATSVASVDTVAGREEPLAAHAVTPVEPVPVGDEPEPAEESAGPEEIGDSDGSVAEPSPETATWAAGPGIETDSEPESETDDADLGRWGTGDDPAPVASEEVGEPDPVIDEPSGLEVDAADVPAVDSPLDATRYIPREEVEAAIGPDLAAEIGPAFEIDQSGHEEVAGWADAPEHSDSLDRSEPAVEPVAERPEAADIETTGFEVDEETAGPHPLSDVTEPVGIETTRLSRDEVDAALRAEEEGHGDAPRDEIAEEEAGPAPESLPEEPTMEATPSWDEPGYGDGEIEHDDWEPPADLESSITRFNAMQRLLYRSIRSEVGAGAANFVRACGGTLEDRLGTVFAEIDLQNDGAWDPNGLKRALVQQRVEEPWAGFRQLLDEEIDRLRVHIGEGRANNLRERLLDLDQEEMTAAQTARPPE